MEISRKIKTKVSSGFKMRGLMLRPDASKYLVEVLESVSSSELEDVIEKVLDAVEKQPRTFSLSHHTRLYAEFAWCHQGVDNVFNIIGAFDVPRYIYSAERKKFIPIGMTSHPAPSLCGSAKDKAELFRERYTLLQQVGDCDCYPLLGSTAKLGEVIVLGMITQLKEGKYYLEDPSGTVQLDMSKFHNGLYTESCFVLAEGWYEDSVFHVNGFGFPPTELSSGTRAYYGNTNFFGGPSTTSVKASAKLKQLEEENEDAMFVIVSDVWLDSVEVMEKLNIMFSGYAAMPPTCFILCGNFSSAPYGKTQIKSLKESLKALADAICSYPSIHSSSRFVFVPGPEDPGPGTILPRPPLADHITEEFRQKVPFSVFTTNPCRIQYCSQEIVIMREDLVNKMCRNCVRLPNNSLDIPNHFVKTILSQGHLSPLPLYVSPVFWAYDFSLRVYPIPDVVVFADKYDPFNITNAGCLCLNPGSFPRSGFSFKVYYPSNRTVEDSKLQGL
uniref:DNA polymerase epsilon subunit n=1 Tax=Salarias fasciatus TaxID=181472 RepID=A0A672HCR2_SALFA